MRPPVLLVYVKPPRIGLSKTRLAGGIGRAEARRIASALLARTLRAARGSGCRVILYVSPDRTSPAPFGGLPMRGQGRGDLTARLRRGLRETPRGPVLFIGADAPDVTAARLRAAAARLRRHGAVIGPACDGGFWLLGLNKRLRGEDPFGGVRWSGPHTLDDVRARLPDGVRRCELWRLPDIDTVEDWRAWQRRAPHSTDFCRRCS